MGYRIDYSIVNDEMCLIRHFGTSIDGKEFVLGEGGDTKALAEWIGKQLRDNHHLDIRTTTKQLLRDYANPIGEPSGDWIANHPAAD